MNATVKVHLLGRDYMLRSQGDPAQVQAAAKLVEEKLSGLPDAVSIDTRDRFMLALLNLAGEFLQVQAAHEELKAELQDVKAEQAAAQTQRSEIESRLIAQIEEALDH